MFDAHKNLAVASVVTAPAPASSGTSLVVGAGQGARFPAVPFNCTIWPVDMAPDPTTAEVVRVTARTTDTLTIVRAQEGTTARTVLAGDLIAATITALSLTDIESGTNFPLITTAGTVTAGGLSVPANLNAAHTATIANTNTGSAAFTVLNVTAGSAAGGAAAFYSFSEGWPSAGGNNSSGSHLFASGAGGLTISASHGAGAIRFQAGGSTERGRVHASGGFSWGSTVDPGANTFFVGPLGVGVGETYLHFSGGKLTSGQPGTGQNFPVAFNNANGQVGYIGTLGTTTSYSTTSDARLKRDRGPHTDLDVLRRTVVHDFTWRTDDTPGVGVFAQEAAEVAPFAVSVGTDARDAADLTHPWGVDYSKFVPDLIVGWQDHDATVIELRGDVAVLTARADAMERLAATLVVPRYVQRPSLVQRVRTFINGLFPAWITP